MMGIKYLRVEAYRLRATWSSFWAWVSNLGSHTEGTTLTLKYYASRISGQAWARQLCHAAGNGNQAGTPLWKTPFSGQEWDDVENT